MRMIFRVVGGERLAVESVERIDVVAPLAPVPAPVGKVGAVVRRVALAEMTRLDPGRERNLAESIGQNRLTLLGDRVALRFFIDGKRQGPRRRQERCRSQKRQQGRDSSLWFIIGRFSCPLSKWIRWLLNRRRPKPLGDRGLLLEMLAETVEHKEVSDCIDDQRDAEDCHNAGERPHHRPRWPACRRYYEAYGKTERQGRRQTQIPKPQMRELALTDNAGSGIRSASFLRYASCASVPTSPATPMMNSTP